MKFHLSEQVIRCGMSKELVHHHPVIKKIKKRLLDVKSYDIYAARYPGTLVESLLTSNSRSSLLALAGS